MSQTLPSVRAVLIVLVLLAIALGLPGCRPPFESRHDSMPGPVTTADLVAASLDEPTPLTLAEWAIADSVLDAYLAEFDGLRTTTIAPHVRMVREDHSNHALSDEQMLARFDRRVQSVVAHIRGLDDALFANLATALPHRAAFAERAAARRAINRAITRAAGAKQDGAAAGFTDLDIEVAAVLERTEFAGQRDALHATLEPLRASYRTELGAAAAALADALVEYPSDRLRALRASGIEPAYIDIVVRGTGDALPAAERDRILAISRRSQQRILRCQVAIDDLNTRTAAAWAAVLPEGVTEQFGSEYACRRAPQDEHMALTLWQLEILQVLPDVREGRAPRLAAAVRDLRTALDAYNAAAMQAWRHTAALPGAELEAPPLANEDTRVVQARARTQQAQAAIFQAAEAELPRETLEKLQSLTQGRTTTHARAVLEGTVGRAHAARLMTRRPPGLLIEHTVEDAAEEGAGASWALKLMLGPLATREDFNSIAASLGATPGDAVVEELWQRYAERADTLHAAQDEALIAREKRINELGPRAVLDPTALERELADYVRALLAADEERAQLMLDTLGELAAGRGVRPDDPRLLIARAQLAVARCMVPWRRFSLPWMLGPLWLSQADAIALATAETPGDPVAAQAVLGITIAHAPELERAALAARLTGFEAMRDFFAIAIALQNAGPSTHWHHVPHLPKVRAITSRARAASAARADAQMAYIAALEPVLGAERSARLRCAYAEATFPEFFRENAWYQAARAAARSADTPQRTHWHDMDALMVDRLLEWERAQNAVAPPAQTADLARVAMEDAELAALRTLRDENALRTLRDTAVAAGEAPDSRMPGALRRVSWPFSTLPR